MDPHAIAGEEFYAQTDARRERQSRVAVNEMSPSAENLLGGDRSPVLSDDAEFVRRYWRSAPTAPGPLAELSSDSVDDATFRLVADNIPTLCWVANGDGYIVWYNRRWHDYCGTTAEQMEGWGWQSVHDPDLLPSVMERWTSAVANGEPFEMTFPLRGADGVFRPFLTRVLPMRDASGAVARWFGTNTEIFDQVTTEEALRAERDRSRSVLDGMTEGFVLLDRDFRVLDINFEGLRIDGRARDQLIGKSHWEGSALELQAVLVKQDSSGIVDRLFPTGQSCGRMLGELARIVPNRVEKKNHHGTSHYRIYPPRRDAVSPEA